MEAIQMAGPDLRRTLTSRKLMDRYGITRSVAHDALHRTATL
jgi:GTP-sensing pleiotropic transcriptional regulator CodY